MKTLRIAIAMLVAIALSAGGALAAQPKPASLEGTYDAEVIAEGAGTTPLTLVIKREGDKLVASSSGSDNLTISGIVVDGDKVTLKAAWQGNEFDLPGHRHGDGGQMEQQLCWRHLVSQEAG